MASEILRLCVLCQGVTLWVCVAGIIQCWWCGADEDSHSTVLFQGEWEPGADG